MFTRTRIIIYTIVWKLTVSSWSRSRSEPCRVTRFESDSSTRANLLPLFHGAWKRRNFMSKHHANSKIGMIILWHMGLPWLLYQCLFDQVKHCIYIGEILTLTDIENFKLQRKRESIKSARTLRIALEHYGLHSNITGCTWTFLPTTISFLTGAVGTREWLV